MKKSGLVIICIIALLMACMVPAFAERVDTVCQKTADGLHVWGDWVKVLPTCTAKGYQYQECTVCNERVYCPFYHPDPLGHSYVDGVCTVCGDTLPVADTTTATCDPTETTCVPVETTCVPVETTCAPVETTCVPVETTCVPVETTCAPVETIAPVETTCITVIVQPTVVEVVATNAPADVEVPDTGVESTVLPIVLAAAAGIALVVISKKRKVTA